LPLPPDHPLDPGHPALEELRARLESEEQAYADVLAAVDRLAVLALPSETAPESREKLERLNALWQPAAPPAGTGLRARLRRRVWDVLAPALERQAEWNANLVQLLNARLAAQDRLDARLRELAGALVRYAQRVLPLVDARDRVVSALTTTRTELVLESFGRRLEAQARQARKAEGLFAMRDRLEVVGEELRALRSSLAATAPPPAVSAGALEAAAAAVYTAFENRFRGSREELRRRQAPDAERFRGLAPVVDLGCGRGEFLELLRETGVAARGVEGNRSAALECREKGLDVLHGDLVDFLRAQAEGSLGGVFAAQVVEHLPPAVLAALLAEAHRALRPGGLLVLETVNVRSATAFFEVYIRDLSHERPLHPETLAFMAAAHGFSDVEIEMRAPIPAAGRLRAVPWQGLPGDAASAINENVERLNALLFAPLDYAVLARR
jgi:SAM-dependent methyltransferase